MEGFFGSAVEVEAQEIVGMELDRQSRSLALAGRAMPPSSKEWLLAQRGEEPVVEMPELLRGHGKLYLTGAIGATAIILWFAAAEIATWGKDDLSSALLRSTAQTAQISIPEIRKPSTAAPASTDSARVPPPATTTSPSGGRGVEPHPGGASKQEPGLKGPGAPQ